MRISKIVISTLLIAFISMAVAFSNNYHREQSIAGFINYEDSSYAKLDVTPDASISSGSDGQKGINLNISDTKNAVRFLIQPSETPLTELGLHIGSFGIEATNKKYELRIYHSVLASQTASVDYELGLSYTSSDGTRTSYYCLSSSVDEMDPRTNEQARVAANKLIKIRLSDFTGVVMIISGGIYFRLSEAVTVPGQYVSNVYFVLGST